MFDKLEDLLVRFEEVLNELGEPGVTDNQERFQKLMKEQSELQPIVDTYKEYKENKELLRNEQQQLELRLSDYQPSSPENFSKKEHPGQKLHTICDVLFSETFSDSQKNEVLRSIIQKMVYDKPQDVLTIYYHLPDS